MERENSQTLIGTDEMLRWWRQSARSGAAGRPERARVLWVRTMRAASNRRHRPEDMRALAGLHSTVAAGGPSVTPAFRAARRRDATRFRFFTATSDVCLDRREVDGLCGSSCFGLVVDNTRQKVFVGGRELPLEGRELPLKILATLVKGRGGPLSLKDLFPGAWGRPFNPSYDSNTVYFHISRLRKLLAEVAPEISVLETTGDGYQLAPGLRYALVEVDERSEKAVMGRHDILTLLKDRGFMDNRGYCKLTGKSRSTALRELAVLVETNVLVREGAGRGARYRLAAGAN